MNNISFFILIVEISIVLGLILVYFLSKLKFKIPIITVVDEKNNSHSSNPIQLMILNKGVSPETVKLFNRNRNLSKDNFDNSKNIEICCSSKEQEYIQILNNISDNPLRTSLIRIQSTNSGQVTQMVNLHSSEANGGYICLPLNTQSYFSANQFQSGIIDIPVDIVIDGNFGMDINILAGTNYVLTIFPSNEKCEISSFRRLIEMLLSGFNLEIVPKIINDKYKPSSFNQIPMFVSNLSLDTKKNKLKQSFIKFINIFKKSNK